MTLSYVTCPSSKRLFAIHGLLETAPSRWWVGSIVPFLLSLALIRAKLQSRLLLELLKLSSDDVARLQNSGTVLFTRLYGLTLIALNVVLCC